VRHPRIDHFTQRWPCGRADSAKAGRRYQFETGQAQKALVVAICHGVKTTQQRPGLRRSRAPVLGLQNSCTIGSSWAPGVPSSNSTARPRRCSDRRTGPAAILTWSHARRRRGLVTSTRNGARRPRVHVWSRRLFSCSGITPRMRVATCRLKLDKGPGKPGSPRIGQQMQVNAASGGVHGSHFPERRVTRDGAGLGVRTCAARNADCEP